MAKKRIIIWIIVLIILAGLAWFVWPNWSKIYHQKKYYENPLYCRRDSDCTIQPTFCCGRPINIYNFKKIEYVPNPEDSIRCMMVCPSTEPKCHRHQCILADDSAILNIIDYLKNIIDRLNKGFRDKFIDIY
jgi:hypothetical protein